MKRTIYNVGGGYEGNIFTGSYAPVWREVGKTWGLVRFPKREPQTYRGLLRLSRIRSEMDWSPKRSIENLFDDVFTWLTDYKESLYGLLGPKS